VFALLGNLKPNDEIVIIYKRKKYVYKVTNQKIIEPSDIQVLSSKEARLTLITCWPVGTSLKRLAVFANQTEKPLPAPTELLLPTSP